MTLLKVIESYVDWQKARGARFDSSAAVLRQYCRQVGGDIGCDAVSEEQVRRFLAGRGPLTRTRSCKFGTLASFYRYAVSRGHVTRSPLPAADSEPPAPHSAPPWVFTRDELRRLFACIDRSRQHARRLDADTLRTGLLLLYGAGLRVSEALRLTFEDVDLDEGVLTVRDSKFHKSRLVPIGHQLTAALRRHARRRQPLPRGRASTFLALVNGEPPSRHLMLVAFKNLLRTAGIRPAANDWRRPPNLHSLRHTAAVHRLENWYRQGADVQRLLPTLATWLGHVNLDATQVYLSMTPELLHQAGRRFERYAAGDDDE